ncbi:hypothetical protein G3N57_07780 [Paraburkholderia sp. Se-20369]|nr:hypothetical protein [Paraburkholderia sp. Se-20369]
MRNDPCAVCARRTLVRPARAFSRGAENHVWFSGYTESFHAEAWRPCFMNGVKSILPAFSHAGETRPSRSRCREGGAYRQQPAAASIEPVALALYAPYPMTIETSRRNSIAPGNNPHRDGRPLPVVPCVPDRVPLSAPAHNSAVAHFFAIFAPAARTRPALECERTIARFLSR